MNIVQLIFAMLYGCLTFMAFAEPTITDLKVTPLSPLGLEVSYMVSGEMPSSPEDFQLTLRVVDRTAGKTYDACSLIGDTALNQGIHHVIWESAKDGIQFLSDNCTVTVSYVGECMYCVIDLSGGSDASHYPISGLASTPSKWGNEYKTTKLVLRRCDAGSFKMRGTTTTTLTKPFYIGVFEVTQKQWELVMGTNPCAMTEWGKGDVFPVHYVSYDMIRGSSNGAQCPISSAVDSTSFVGKLQAKTGLNFDLPTEAQWEYACRAGTTTAYYWGDSMDVSYATYGGDVARPVGTKKPNAWGLYDMSGNVEEWCLDWYNPELPYGTDPKGPSSGTFRVVRGGTFCMVEQGCTSSYVGISIPSYGSCDKGFRLSRTLP